MHRHNMCIYNICNIFGIISHIQSKEFGEEWGELFSSFIEFLLLRNGTQDIPFS